MAKAQKKPPKEYLSERIKEALEINRKAEELLKLVLGEELYLARKDKELWGKEEMLVADIKKIEEELKEISLEEYMLDKALQEKSEEAIKKMCNEMRQRISTIIKELELLKSEEHALEEKKATEVKELKEEWSDTGKAEDLMRELKELEERVILMAESSLTSKIRKKRKG